MKILPNNIKSDIDCFENKPILNVEMKLELGQKKIIEDMRFFVQVSGENRITTIYTSSEGVKFPNIDHGEFQGGLGGGPGGGLGGGRGGLTGGFTPNRPQPTYTTIIEASGEPYIINNETLLPQEYFSKIKTFLTFLFKRTTKEEAKKNKELLKRIHILGSNVSNEVTTLHFVKNIESIDENLKELMEKDPEALQDTMKWKIDYEKCRKIIEALGLKKENAPYIILSRFSLTENEALNKRNNKKFKNNGIFPISFNIQNIDVLSNLINELEDIADGTAKDDEIKKRTKIKLKTKSWLGREKVSYYIIKAEIKDWVNILKDFKEVFS